MSYKGRAYQCKWCSKVDRKGRTVAHILKHHVPFDRVPFSCSLCNFRCQDRETLVNHINRYKRHRDEVQRRGGRIDHSQVLNKSSDPRYIGEDDMLLMTREESGRHFTRQEDPLDDDGIFDEQEDEGDELSLPDWAKDVQPYIATPLGPAPPVTKQQVFRTNSPVLHMPPIQTITTSIPVVPRCLQSTATITSSGQLAGVLPCSYPSVNTSQPFTTLCLQDLVTSSNQQTNLTSNLGQFRPSRSSMTCTPLMDEKDTSGLEDILPGLMKAASDNDPLMMEIQNEARGEKRSTEEEGDLSKKAKVSSEQCHTCNSCTSSTDFTPLVNILEKATKEIVDAIDRNTRAIRCQDKTLDEVVSGLKRMEKILQSQTDSTTSRHRSPVKENRRENKENYKPVLKSSVTKINTEKK